MIGFVHRNNIIVAINKVKRTSIQTIQLSDEKPLQYNWICTNLDGKQFLFQKEYVKNFNKIKILLPNEKRISDESFPSSYIKSLQEMIVLENEESFDYIMGNKNGWGKKRN